MTALRHGQSDGFVVFRFWIVVLLISFSPGFAQAGKEDKLPPHYRQWLDRDVAYVITREEKVDFLNLKTDEERDKFINEFWEIRNPTPGAPTNPYKEEHYRRLEYANEHFGIGKRVEGWGTDRGRVYITLGPPQQKALYYNFDRVRPTEVWFYSSSNPALPPFFYIAFYQQDNVDDFRLYSPYFDGPEKLVTARGFTRAQALKLIDREAGREVARVALSLLPDEPADLQTATSSMQSDVMLSVIHDLANYPRNREDIQRRWLQASVSARLILEGQTLGVLTVPLRDSEGDVHLHYVLRLKQPGDFVVGQSSDGGYYYSIEVRVRVFGPDNKLIFTQERPVKRSLNREQMDLIKSRVFGYEGWLPLPPGKYRVEFLLTNWLRKAAYRAETDVAIPDLPDSGLRVAELAPFSRIEAVDPDRFELIPFSAAGAKFVPLLPRELNFSPAQSLNVFYQIWAPPTDPQTYHGKKLEIEYAYGRPGMRGDAKVIRDDVQEEQFDPNGSMVNGKQIALRDLNPGNYLLTMTVSDPASQQKVYASLGFHVLPEASRIPAWDIHDEEMTEDVRTGVSDYHRGLCYLALGEKELAGKWFERALEKSPVQEDARTALVDLDFTRQAFGEVAKIARQVPLTNQTAERTILRMAESLDKIGKGQEAIRLLESALSIKAPSSALYLTLAFYYQRMGDTQKAEEMQRKGKLLLDSNSPSSRN